MSLQPDQISVIRTHWSNIFKHCFMNCWRSIVWSVMTLSHNSSLSMRASQFFTRSKCSSELRLLYEQVHKEVIDKIIMINEMWDTTSWEYQVQTVITLLAASHSTASFVVNLLICDWSILTLQWFIDTSMTKHLTVDFHKLWHNLWDLSGRCGDTANQSHNLTLNLWFITCEHHRKLSPFFVSANVMGDEHFWALQCQIQTNWLCQWGSCLCACTCWWSCTWFCALSTDVATLS